MSEKKEKRVFRFELDKRRKLVAGIRKMEAMLKDLPSETQRGSMFPKGPTLEEARSTLEANRRELVEQLGKEAEKVGELEPRSIYPASPPRTRKRELTGKLKGIFADSACTPSRPEQKFISPISIDADSYTEPEGSGGALIYPWDWPAQWYFVMTVEDNNDPFNKDTTELWMQARYLYELPSRPFPARYDLEIYGNVDLEITSRSNHIFGSHWWRGWVNGALGLELEGEVYYLPDPSLRISGVKEWDNNDWSYHKAPVFERSVVLEPDQSIGAELAYIFFVRIDRGVAAGYGLYGAFAPYVSGAPPDLRCIITPEY